MINDGPRVGPFSSLKTYFIELVEWCKQELHYINEKILEQNPKDEVFHNPKIFAYAQDTIFEKIEIIQQYLNSSKFGDPKV